MIFIVGAHAAGKTHSANLICKKNFEMIDLGPLVRAAHKNSGSEQNISDWIKESEAKYGKNFTDDLLVVEIKKTIDQVSEKVPPPVDILIIGSRSVAGLQYILKHVDKYNNKENTIIYLETPFLMAYERFIKREGVQITKEAFQSLLDKDRAMGIDNLRSIANFIITNDSTDELFYEKIKEILGDKLHYEGFENSLWKSKIK